MPDFDNLRRPCSPFTIPTVFLNTPLHENGRVKALFHRLILPLTFVTFDTVIMPVFHPEARGFNTIPGNLRFDTVSHRAVLSVRVDPSLQDLQVAAIECYAVFKAMPDKEGQQ